jgi:uncharacterized protein (TIGR02118 family)
MAIYGAPDDPEAFERYYHETHVPLALTVPHLAHGESALVLGTPDGGPAPYYRVAALSFATMEDFEGAAASPEGTAALADLANFATGGVTLVIAQVDVTYSSQEHEG